MFPVQRENTCNSLWIVNIPPSIYKKIISRGVLNGIPSAWHHSLYQQRFKFSPVYSRCITCNFIFNVFIRFFLSFRSLSLSLSLRFPSIIFFSFLDRSTEWKILKSSLIDHETQASWYLFKEREREGATTREVCCVWERSLCLLFSVSLSARLIIYRRRE